MRHIRFLAVHAHFSEDLQYQVVSGTRTFNSSNGRTKITVTPTSGTICGMPVWELRAECPEKEVQRLISVILPSMAAPSSSLSPSCKVTSSLIANTHNLDDGTYLHTADGNWARYDQADSLLATLDPVTEVFEVPRDDPRRQHSNISNQLLSSVAASTSSPAASGDKPTAVPSSSKENSTSASTSTSISRHSVVIGDQQKQQQQQRSQHQREEIFRGLRARCSIPANVPITTYDGLIVTSLDPVRYSAAAGAAGSAGQGTAAQQQPEDAADTGYFQRYLLGPEQYFQNTSVFNYGNPMTKGPMINDAAGTGKQMNCGMGCLLRKKDRAVSLQDVVLSVRPIAAEEELLTAYKMSAAPAAGAGAAAAAAPAAPVAAAPAAPAPAAAAIAAAVASQDRPSEAAGAAAASGGAAAQE